LDELYLTVYAEQLFTADIITAAERADKSAVCAINRHLLLIECMCQCAWTVIPCHPECSERPVAIGSEILRFAQDDRAGPCCWIGTVTFIWTMPYYC